MLRYTSKRFVFAEEEERDLALTLNVIMELDPIIDWEMPLDKLRRVITATVLHPENGIRSIEMRKLTDDQRNLLGMICSKCGFSLPTVTFKGKKRRN